MNLFDTLFYQPLLNFLVLIYNLLPFKDLGLVVILLTILIKLILWPFNSKGIESQRALKELEPKLKELREKFKDNEEELARRTMALYQEAKINPFSGILLLFIQLPVLFAIFKLFQNVASTESLTGLYPFIISPGRIEPFFLKMNLAANNAVMAALAAAFQFVQSKFFSPELKIDEKNKSAMAGIWQKQMIYFLPLFTFFILLKIPAAISLYLIVSTIFAIIQSIYISRKKCSAEKK